MAKTPIAQSRLALICCCVCLFIATVIGLCGGNSLACFAVITSDGMVALGWVLGACALGSLVLRPFRFEINRALFVATAGGLGLGIFSLLGLGFGLLGWLNRPVAIAIPVVSVLLLAIDRWRRSTSKLPTSVLRYSEEPGERSNPPGSSEYLRTGVSKKSTILQYARRHRNPFEHGESERWLRQPAGASWLWLVPVVALAIAAVSASIMPGVLWKPLDPHPYDVTSYHLLVPREWYELGRIVPLDHNVFSYFPFNAEMQFLLLMHAMGGPWAGMYACQFVSVGYASLMVLAVYGAVETFARRTSNVQRPTSNSEISLVRSWTFAFSSVIGAAFGAVVPWTLMLAGVAYVESGLMLYTALSIAWALHAIKITERSTSSLILAGIMTGFACGVKITAVPMLLLAVPTAVFAVSIFQKEIRKRILIGCIGLIIAGSIVLSPWLIRNFLWSHNPLFPIGMKKLGQDHFTDQQVERFRIAHSPKPAQQTFGGKSYVLWTDVISHWQFGFVFFPVAIIALAVRWRDRQTWLLFICGLFVLVVWIGFTHLLPRFLVMVIPIGAIAIGRIQWGRAWPAGVLLVITSAGFGWGYVMPELYKQSNPPPFEGQPRPALFGFDPAFMMSPELINARDNHLQIGLVGDAQAFLYEVPMSQMHYRTVFNLQGDDAVDAWVGPQARGNPNWMLVINPAEIDRLNRTYQFVPALPPEWAAHGNDPFYLQADHLQDDDFSSKIMK